MKKLLDPEEPFERFFTIFEPMLKKMGPVLLQLPPFLKFDYNRAEHLYRLMKQYEGSDFVMEVRHQSWMGDESIRLMAGYQVGLVISQSGEGFPYSEMITAKNIYVRFHGPHELYASSYDDRTLTRFNNKFKKWAREGYDVWVFFNNDIHGYAISDAKKLLDKQKK
jgi:uncharacterized protein YecE (DUF72 family)